MNKVILKFVVIFLNRHMNLNLVIYYFVFNFTICFFIKIYSIPYDNDCGKNFKNYGYRCFEFFIS